MSKLRERLLGTVITALLVLPPGLIWVYTDRARERRQATCAAVHSTDAYVTGVLAYIEAGVLQADAKDPAAVARDTAFFAGIPKPKGC